MVLRLVVSAVVFLVVVRAGIAVLRALARPVPPPLPPGELRRVNMRYRCTICGTEVKMTAAADEEPAPPRHCQEDMQLVAPAWE
ncbi:MAG TPA: hypothetical protein VF954_03640 [Acidimicrobiales bacterium]